MMSFRLRMSRVLCVFLGVLSLAGLITVFLYLEFWVAVGLATFILIYTRMEFYRVCDTHKITFLDSGEWRIFNRMNPMGALRELSPHIFVSSWVVLVKLRNSENLRSHYLVIVADSLPRAQYRELSARLRMKQFNA